MPFAESSRYRQRVAECEKLARNATDLEQKAEFEKMARS